MTRRLGRKWSANSAVMQAKSSMELTDVIGNRANFHFKQGVKGDSTGKDVQPIEKTQRIKAVELATQEEPGCKLCGNK